MGLDESEEEQQQQENVEVQYRQGFPDAPPGRGQRKIWGAGGVNLDAMTCSMRQIFESAFYGARAPRELGCFGDVCRRRLCKQAVVAASELGLGESASVVGSHSPGPRGRGGVVGALSRQGRDELAAGVR